MILLKMWKLTNWSFNPLLIGEGLAMPKNLPRSKEEGWFQSPSHRGGSCDERDTSYAYGNVGFQSPSHRGGSCD